MNSQKRFSPRYGFGGVTSGFTVALKQLMPEQEIHKSIGDVLRIKVFQMNVSISEALTDSHIGQLFGVFCVWILHRVLLLCFLWNHLCLGLPSIFSKKRFQVSSLVFSFSSHSIGDPSNDFSFASFFP